MEDVLGWHIFGTNVTCCGLAIREVLQPWPSRRIELELISLFAGAYLHPDREIRPAMAPEIQLLRSAAQFEGIRFSYREAPEMLIEFKRAAIGQMHLLGALDPKIGTVSAYAASTI
ncbi:hypothetical protein EAS56_17665 [Bradyrhizobium guangzhouense]|uniref:Uncharacterized protein n=1 Tax=Bradyrhizobium guangzhouense TaxID=1325095 RepID=A0ABY0E4Z3_9BRAD|nr:hypothetical protein [Bradyrhizobium guangzhouense]RXH12336.1 hypothetical protein EAS56_17665 [Bradyrhizobium guangzhouense]